MTEAHSTLTSTHINQVRACYHAARHALARANQGQGSKHEALRRMSYARSAMHRMLYGAPEQYTPDFYTRVQNIPCGVVVTHFVPYTPMRITGWGFGDALPPEGPECEFLLTDRRGYRAKWLSELMSIDDVQRIEKEIETNAG